MSRQLSPRSKKQASFSQSLTNVRWRFLREDNHKVQEQNTGPITNLSNTTQSRRRKKRSPRNGSSVLSAGSEVMRRAPPVIPGDGEVRDGASTLSRVRDLQEALSHNDFPSKVFRYLSVGSSTNNNNSNSHVKNNNLAQQWGNDSFNLDMTLNMNSNGGSAVAVPNNGLGGQSSIDTNAYGDNDGGFSNEDIQREMERLSRDVPSNAPTWNKSMTEAAATPVRKKKTNNNNNNNNNAQEMEEDENKNQDPDEEYFSDGSVSSVSSVEEDDRPVSPIIIWRPSARVQIADDLPPELLAELLGESSITSSNVAATSMTARPFVQQASKSSKSSTSSKSPRGSGTLKNGGNAILNTKNNNGNGKSFLNKDYGAWYLKPKQWNDMMNGDLQSEYEKSQNARISGSDAEIDHVIETKAKELDNVLPKLFISSVYRDWLEKQEKEHPESTLPIPYYLKSKKMQANRHKKK